MTTYENMAAAVADPASNASKAMAAMREARAEAQAQVAALMAQGLTREQAWSRLCG